MTDPVNIKGYTAHVGTPEWNAYPDAVKRTLAWRRLHQLVDHSALSSSGATSKDSANKLTFMVKYLERIRKG